MTRRIHCRAHVSRDCEHGRPEVPESEMWTDGTYDGASIVCDFCFMALMPLTPSRRALNHELPAAIATARRG